MFWILFSVCLAFVSPFLFEKQKNTSICLSNDNASYFCCLILYIVKKNIDNSKYVSKKRAFDACKYIVSKSIHFSLTQVHHQSLFDFYYKMNSPEFTRSFKINPIKVVNSFMHRQIKNANIIDGEDTEPYLFKSAVVVETAVIVMITISQRLWIDSSWTIGCEWLNSQTLWSFLFHKYFHEFHHLQTSHLNIFGLGNICKHWVCVKPRTCFLHDYKLIQMRNQSKVVHKGWAQCSNSPWWQNDIAVLEDAGYALIDLPFFFQKISL